jgi:hypothetical protein
MLLTPSGELCSLSPFILILSISFPLSLEYCSSILGGSLGSLSGDILYSIGGLLSED